MIQRPRLNNPRNRSSILCARSTAWMVLTVLLATVHADERPNILVIMSDDHTAQAIGAYATLLKDLDPAPTIDSIAAEGICFDNAFCTNSICTPSRACIITGQYDHINGVFDLGVHIKPENQTLPILMREAGCQTAIIGKWHPKSEPNFDCYKVLPGQGKYFDTEFRLQGKQKWPKNTVQYRGSHSTDVITDTALDWFKNKPWAYDASQRMPLIVRYPKSIPAGSRSNTIIENIDFPALMLDYAGIEVPSSMQGRSFQKICETGAEPGRWKQASFYRY